MNFCILDCSLSCLNPEMGLYHSTTFGRYVICCCWLPHHYEDMSKAEHLLMSSYAHYVHVLTSELPWCNQALTRYLTDAMRESRVLEFLHAVRIHHYDPNQRIIQWWCLSYVSVWYRWEIFIWLSLVVMLKQCPMPNFELMPWCFRPVA